MERSAENRSSECHREVAVLGVIMLLAVGCADRGNDSWSPRVRPQRNHHSPASMVFAKMGQCCLQIQPVTFWRRAITPSNSNMEVALGPTSCTCRQRRSFPAPIIVALHGGGGTGQAFQEQNGLDRVAEREGFVAVVTGRPEQATELLEMAIENATPGSMSDLNRLV